MMAAPGRGGWSAAGRPFRDSLDIAALIDGLVPADGQRGVIVATANGAICLDLFDKPGTLATYWDGLLAGYALDALEAGAPHFDQADAEAFVVRILAAEIPAVGLGTELHIGAGDLTGGALTWAGAVVHLAAFGSPWVAPADGDTPSGPQMALGLRALATSPDGP
jgi:hypothetical protein